MNLDRNWRDVLFNPGAHCPGSSLGLLVLRISMAWQGVVAFQTNGDANGWMLLQGLLYSLGLGTRLLPILLLVLWGWYPDAWVSHSWQNIAIQAALSLTGAGSLSLDAKMTRARGYLPCAGS